MSHSSMTAGRVTRVMVGLVFLLCTACATTARAPLHAALESESYGFGPGIVVEEIRREPAESQFRIRRLYEYDASTAWGTPQNWFLICALRDVAIEHGFAQMKIVFEVREGDRFRALQPRESFSEVGRDDLFVKTLWLPDDGRTPQQLLTESIFSVAGSEAFCRQQKARSKAP